MVRVEGRLRGVIPAMIAALGENRDGEAQSQEKLRGLHLGGDSAPERGSIFR